MAVSEGVRHRRRSHGTLPGDVPRANARRPDLRLAAAGAARLRRDGDRATGLEARPRDRERAKHPGGQNRRAPGRDRAVEELVTRGDSGRERAPEGQRDASPASRRPRRGWQGGCHRRAHRRARGRAEDDEGRDGRRARGDDQERRAHQGRGERGSRGGGGAVARGAKVSQPSSRRAGDCAQGRRGGGRGETDRGEREV